LWVLCEEGADLGELFAVGAVFEGVHVASGRACAGAFSSSGHVHHLRFGG
jgi:hypothetical protein